MLNYKAIHFIMNNNKPSYKTKKLTVENNYKTII